VSWAARCGVSESDILLIGRWVAHSKCFLIYHKHGLCIAKKYIFLGRRSSNEKRLGAPDVAHLRAQARVLWLPHRAALVERRHAAVRVPASRRPVLAEKSASEALWLPVDEHHQVLQCAAEVGREEAGPRGQPGGQEALGPWPEERETGRLARLWLTHEAQREEEQVLERSYDEPGGEAEAELRVVERVLRLEAQES
jgi:hypothetical protein